MNNKELKLFEFFCGDKIWDTNPSDEELSQALSNFLYENNIGAEEFQNYINKFLDRLEKLGD